MYLIRSSEHLIIGRIKRLTEWNDKPLSLNLMNKAECYSAKNYNNEQRTRQRE